jgi:hypothetical protein
MRGRRSGHLGGIALGTLVGIWRLRWAGVSVAEFMDAAAPALLVGQAIGRIGNYFNQELFGGPTGLPWGLEISAAHRPDGYAAYSTFQPTFLYELIWNLSLAALLVWLGKPPPHPPAGPLRALRHRLLGIPHLRGVLAGRSGPPHPRPAVELLRRLCADRCRRRLVRGDSEAWTSRRSEASAGADAVGYRLGDLRHGRLRSSVETETGTAYTSRSYGGSWQARAFGWQFALIILSPDFALTPAVEWARLSAQRQCGAT